MQHAASRVGRLAAEEDLAVRSRVKVRAEGNQPVHGVGAPSTKRATVSGSLSPLPLPACRPRAGRDCHPRQRPRIVRPGRSRCCSAQNALGQQGDAQLGRKGEGEGQTGHPGANDVDAVVLWGSDDGSTKGTVPACGWVSVVVFGSAVMVGCLPQSTPPQGGGQINRLSVYRP